MPGLYGITTRAPGTLITALIYNHDHIVHVDGRDAESMQAHATSVSQMNVTQSPYSSGTTELLPISLANELMVLRFVIAQVKTSLNGGVAVNWWSAVPAPAFAAVAARVRRNTSQSIPDSVGTKIDFTGGVAAINTNTIWNSGLNQTRFTAPFSGLYYVFANVLWQGSGAGRRQIQAAATSGFGAQTITKTNTTQGGQAQRQCLGGLMKLTAADYVEFSAFQDSGGALNLLGESNDSIVGGIVYFGVAQ